MSEDIQELKGGFGLSVLGNSKVYWSMLLLLLFCVVVCAHQKNLSSCK